MGIPAGAQVVAWFAIAGGVGFVAVRQARLSDRLDALDAAERTRVETPAEGGTGDGAVAEVARKVATLEGRVTQQAEALPKIEGETQRLWAELGRAPVAKDGEAAAKPVDPAALAGDPNFEDAVRGVVDKYVLEKKFKDAIQKATGPLVPKKPAYGDLAKALALKPDQAERFAQDIQGIQHELFDLLSVPRSDGVVPMEEIQQAEQYPEGSPQKAAVFLKLFRLTIPDTQETYIERAISLVQRVKEQAKSYFEEGQYQTLDSIDLDYFGIRFPQ